jgi:hypothetical protein
LVDSRASGSFTLSGRPGIDAQLHGRPNFVDNAVGRVAVYAGHRLHFEALVLAFYYKNRVNKIVGGEARFLHHVADYLRLTIAAGAVSWNHNYYCLPIREIGIFTEKLIY